MQPWGDIEWRHSISGVVSLSLWLLFLQLCTFLSTIRKPFRIIWFPVSLLNGMTRFVSWGCGACSLQVWINFYFSSKMVALKCGAGFWEDRLRSSLRILSLWQYVRAFMDQCRALNRIFVSKINIRIWDSVFQFPYCIKVFENTTCLRNRLTFNSDFFHGWKCKRRTGNVSIPF